jgi:hypothetical protein
MTVCSERFRLLAQGAAALLAKRSNRRAVGVTRARIRFPERIVLTLRMTVMSKDKMMAQISRKYGFIAALGQIGRLLGRGSDDCLTPLNR